MINIDPGIKEEVIYEILKKIKKGNYTEEELKKLINDAFDLYNNKMVDRYLDESFRYHLSDL